MLACFALNLQCGPVGGASELLLGCLIDLSWPWRSDLRVKLVLSLCMKGTTWLTMPSSELSSNSSTGLKTKRFAMLNFLAVYQEPDSSVVMIRESVNNDTYVGCATEIMGHDIPNGPLPLEHQKPVFKGLNSTDLYHSSVHKMDEVQRRCLTCLYT
jgi:hypothetical protein